MTTENRGHPYPEAGTGAEMQAAMEYFAALARAHERCAERARAQALAEESAAEWAWQQWAKAREARFEAAERAAREPELPFWAKARRQQAAREAAEKAAERRVYGLCAESAPSEASE